VIAGSPEDYLELLSYEAIVWTSCGTAVMCSSYSCECKWERPGTEASPRTSCILQDFEDCLRETYMYMYTICIHVYVHAYNVHGHCTQHLDTSRKEELDVTDKCKYNVHVHVNNYRIRIEESSESENEDR
jgi:hypothetical protein